MSFANDVRAEVVLRRADDDASGIERCLESSLPCLGLTANQRTLRGRTPIESTVRRLGEPLRKLVCVGASVSLRLVPVRWHASVGVAWYS